MTRPSVYKSPFRKIRQRFSMSLLMNPIAAMFVAKGHGDIAVSNPNMNAVKAGVVLLSNKVCNHSISSILITF